MGKAGRYMLPTTKPSSLVPQSFEIRVLRLFLHGQAFMQLAIGGIPYFKRSFDLLFPRYTQFDESCKLDMETACSQVKDVADTSFHKIIDTLIKF